MDALVERPRSTITQAILKEAIESGETDAWLDVLVTPALAKVMLQYNQPGETNRKLNGQYVANQAEEISAKRWENTGEPIIFAKGILNDGQHRLNAIVKSGVPAIMDIRFGIARHAVYSTNSGMKRSSLHALQIAGVPAGAMHGAVVRMITAYEAGKLPNLGKHRVNNGEVVDIVMGDAMVNEAVRLGAQCPRFVNNAAVVSAIYFGLHVANRATVDDFAAVLQDGGGSTSNPPHRLREHLLAGGGQYSTQERVSVLAKSIQAWNAFKAGTPIGKWWRAGEPFPRVEGYKNQPR